METIDVTPTWADQMKMCIFILETSEYEDSKATAREEILRCGQLLDNAHAHIEEQQDAS